MTLCLHCGLTWAHHPTVFTTELYHLLYIQYHLHTVQPIYTTFQFIEYLLKPNLKKYLYKYCVSASKQIKILVFVSCISTTLISVDSKIFVNILKNIFRHKQFQENNNHLVIFYHHENMFFSVSSFIITHCLHWAIIRYNMVFSPCALTNTTEIASYGSRCSVVDMRCEDLRTPAQNLLLRQLSTIYGGGRRSVYTEEL